MRIIGLTGGLASGKSTVGRLLRGLGAPVLDADQIAREVVEPGRPAYQQIVERFGTEMLQSGTDHAAPQGPRPIDRARLAERVFTDEAARLVLNAITHPEIARESARQMAELGAAGHKVAIYEATLIVENGLDKGLSGVIVVDLPEDEQVRRAVARGLSQSQSLLRIRAQADRQARLAAATWVIDNSGSEAATAQRVTQVWTEITSQPAAAD